MVKGANSDGLWNPEIRSLEIRVLPPFYLSTAAYVVYILLLLGLICSVFFYFRRRGVEKHRRDMEKFEQEKERELYISKIEFFTNVAHGEQCTIGIEKIKRLQSSERSITKLPPCNSANERASASPIPVPDSTLFPSR